MTFSLRRSRFPRIMPLPVGHSLASEGSDVSNRFPEPQRPYLLGEVEMNDSQAVVCW